MGIASPLVVGHRQRMTTIFDLPDPFSLRLATTKGVTRYTVRKGEREGVVYRRRKGWYGFTGVTIGEGDRWELIREDHLVRLRQALRDHPGCAASHSSAAIVHNLPVVMSPNAEVELVRVEDYPSSRNKPGVKIHHTDSTETPTVIVGGTRVTTVPRTLADTLRTRRLPHGLALLDQSLRTELVDLDSVRHELSQQHRWVGRPRALRVLDLADPVRESWGESYSYGVLADQELPLPIPQVEVYDESFAFVARLDGLLDHERVATEIDGMAKYLIGATPDTAESTALRNLEAEKLRQDRIERLGLGLARWTVDEAMRSPEVISSRINTAAREVHGREFTGWVRWQGSFRKLPLLPRPGLRVA